MTAIEAVVAARGIAGFDLTPSGDPVYAAHRDGAYDLWTGRRRLTEGGDYRFPVVLGDRDSAIALATPETGVVATDLVAVDLAAGEVTPVFEGEGMVRPPVQSPADPDRIGFVHFADAGPRVCELDLDSGSTRTLATHDDPGEFVLAFDYSPDGDRIVYEVGSAWTDTSLWIAPVGVDDDGDEESDADSARPLLDFEGASASLGAGEVGTFALRPGADLWGPRGILVSATVDGPADLGVAAPGGGHEWLVRSDRDLAPAGWGPGGEAAFLEKATGQTHLRVYADGVTETVADGVVGFVRFAPDGTPVYSRSTCDAARNVWRADRRLTDEGVVGDGDDGDADAIVAPETVTYEADDGASIPALLYPGGDRAVVYAHGGIGSRVTEALEDAWLVESLALSGYTVLAPDYRGSSGHGPAFERANDGQMGVRDRDDLVSGASWLRDRGFDAVGICGESVGGYLTLRALTTTRAFDAGVALAPITDFAYAHEQAGIPYADRKFGGTDEATLADRSPITHAADLSAPVLLVHGTADQGVPVEQSRRFVDRLDGLTGVPEYDFVTYEAGHLFEDPTVRLALVERVDAALSEWIPPRR